MISDKYACLIQNGVTPPCHGSKCAVICDTANAAKQQGQKGGCAYAHSVFKWCYSSSPLEPARHIQVEGIVKPGAIHKPFYPGPWMPADCRDFTLLASLALCTSQAWRQFVSGERAPPFWLQTISVYSNVVGNPSAAIFKLLGAWRGQGSPTGEENRPPVKLIAISMSDSEPCDLSPKNLGRAFRHVLLLPYCLSL